MVRMRIIIDTSLFDLMTHETTNGEYYAIRLKRSTNQNN